MNRINFRKQIKAIINEELENARHNIEMRIDVLIKDSAYADELTDIPNITTKEMKLNAYIVSRLQYADILTLRDICGCTESELSHIRGIGNNSLEEIKKKVAEYGYSLR